MPGPSTVQHSRPDPHATAQDTGSSGLGSGKCRCRELLDDNRNQNGYATRGLPDEDGFLGASSTKASCGRCQSSCGTRQRHCYQ